MLALILALICLFTIDLPAADLPAARPDVQRPSAPELDVYLKDAPSAQNANGGSSAVLKQMARELTLLMGPAGFRVVVRNTFRNNSKPVVAGATAIEDRQYLVTVELRGLCAVPKTPPGEPLRTTLPLASSSVVDGIVLPFTWIDCDALNRFLTPELASQPSANSTYYYGRAMARLLAHEFYHVLTQSEEHAFSGVAKARLSTNDLLADHFHFDQQALGKFHSVELAQTQRASPQNPLDGMPHDTSLHDTPIHDTPIHDDVAVGGR